MKWNLSGVTQTLVLAAILTFASGCAVRDNITGPGTPPSTDGKTVNLVISANFPNAVPGSQVLINGTLDPAYDSTNTEARHYLALVGNDGRIVPVTLTVPFNKGLTYTLYYQNTDGTWSPSLDLTVNGTTVTEYNTSNPNARYGVVRIDSYSHLVQYRDDRNKLINLPLTYDGTDAQHPETVAATDSIYYRSTWGWPDDHAMSWNGSAKTVTLTVSKGDTGWVAIRDINHTERVAGVRLGGTLLQHCIPLSPTYRVFQYFVDANGNVINPPGDTRWGTITLHSPRGAGKTVPERRSS